MSNNKPSLEKLIKLNQSWLSRTYTLHSINSYNLFRKKIKIILDCGKIIIVNNSRNSSSIRHLINNRYNKICKKCKVPDYKIEIFKTKNFNITENINKNKKINNIDLKQEKEKSKTKENIKITNNMKQRIEYFFKSENEKKLIEENIYSIKELEAQLINKRNKAIQNIYDGLRTNDLAELERKLSLFFREKGFLEVKTPLIIQKNQIELMGISPDNDSNYKTFKLTEGKYLRPMLAPGLYAYLKKLDKILQKPVKVFEIGKCFRRESDTNSHLEEFTMLNFCHMGNDVNEEKLIELIKELLNYLNIDFTIINDNCQVYGKTIDVINKNMELASAVVGPVTIDIDWDIHKKWIGAGFGLERLLKAKNNYINIKRSESSENYYNGYYLN